MKFIKTASVQGCRSCREAAPVIDARVGQVMRMAPMSSPMGVSSNNMATDRTPAPSVMAMSRRATPNIGVSRDVNDLPPTLANRVRSVLLNGQQLAGQPAVRVLIDEIPAQFGRAKARLMAAYRAQSFGLITLFSPEQMQRETNAIGNALGELTAIGGSYWTTKFDRTIFSLQTVGTDVARLLTSGTSEEISRYTRQMYIAIDDLSKLETTTFLPLIAARARLGGALQSTVMYLIRYADRLQSVASAIR